MSLDERFCRYCGASFKLTDKRQYYCSAECRTKANRMPRPRRPSTAKDRACPQCGKMFTPGRGQIYCSRECFALAHPAKQHWEPENRTCRICGKEFLPYNYNQKYCSTECSAAANRMQAKQRNEKAIAEHRCIYCGAIDEETESGKHICKKCKYQSRHRKSFRNDPIDIQDCPINLLPNSSRIDKISINKESDNQMEEQERKVNSQIINGMRCRGCGKPLPRRGWDYPRCKACYKAIDEQIKILCEEEQKKQKDWA